MKTLIKIITKGNRGFIVLITGGLLLLALAVFLTGGPEALKQSAFLAGVFISALVFLS